MEKKRKLSELVQSVAKAKTLPVIEIDKTGPIVHVSIPGYESWVKLFVNDVRVGIYQLKEGRISIQLSEALPYEYRVRVEVLKNK